jgi:hypothetical protein
MIGLTDHLLEIIRAFFLERVGEMLKVRGRFFRR